MPARRTTYYIHHLRPGTAYNNARNIMGTRELAGPPLPPPSRSPRDAPRHPPEESAQALFISLSLFLFPRSRPSRRVYPAFLLIATGPRGPRYFLIPPPLSPYRG